METGAAAGPEETKQKTDCGREDVARSSTSLFCNYLWIPRDSLLITGSNSQRKINNKKIGARGTLFLDFRTGTTTCSAQSFPHEGGGASR